MLNKTTPFVHFIISMFNYLWLEKTSVLVGATTPYTISPVREVDCFDALTLSFTITGNTALDAITISVRWYDVDNNFIFADSTSSISTLTGSVFNQIPIKGTYALLQLVGSTSVTLQLSCTAILVVS